MSTVNTSERQCLYVEVTYRIIAELEAGRLPWVQPWDASRCPCTLPHNAGSGRTYSGINILILCTHPVWPALPGLERTLLRTLLRAHSGAVNAADYGDVRA